MTLRLVGIHRSGEASGRIGDVSDFGFDAYALDDADAAGHPHPLKIARDLIATGKPRSALEVLSLHHDQLLDDPEYLLLCAEAWQASDEALRAQQALLGAARLAPEDPRPLQWLGELLAERGEHDKAERVLAKARALEDRASLAEEPHDVAGPETEDDLIAFAERQERSHQVALTPRQVLFGAAALAVLALVVVGIAVITSPRESASPPRGSAPPSDEGDAVASVSAPEDKLAETSEDQPEQIEIREPKKPELPVELPPEPELAATLPAAEAAEVAALETPEPEASAALDRPKPKARSKPKANSAPATQSSKAAPSPRDEAPHASVVQAELASFDVKRLTTRADTLYARGHSGVAASYYRRALELDPDYAPALVGIGQSLLRAKKYSEAMRNATRALQFARGVDARPGLEATAIYQLGRVHYERGERDSARRLFRQSISLPGTPAEAWFYLGEALSSDNSPAARDAYEKYLELVPKGHFADRARRAIQ